MDDAPRSKPPSHREDALTVVKTLRDAGHVAYFAGGSVRDTLLNLDPKDYDVATDAVPSKVRTLFRHTQAVGQAFGVILVHIGQSVIEVATFRTDGKYLDGRRPSQVQFTTAEEDAKRRDFTINGLFLDPLTNQVIDYVGGQADLQTKTLRAIGDANARFDEDYLRLLRAIRFAARFSLEIEPETLAAIATHAERLAAISPERVGEEIRLMLTAPTRSAAWKTLRELQLATVVFRFLSGAQSQTTATSLVSAIAPNTPIPFGLALAAATLDILGWPSLDDSAKRSLLSHASIQAAVRALRQSLKISNEESDDLAGALEGISPLIADSPPSLATKKRFLARPSTHLSRELLEAIASIGIWPERIHALRDEFASLEKTDFAPPPLVTGDDLTAAGLTPGPTFRRVLHAVYDAQLEGRVSTKADAMEAALRLARE